MVIWKLKSLSTYITLGILSSVIYKRIVSLGHKGERVILLKFDSLLYNWLKLKRILELYETEIASYDLIIDEIIIFKYIF